MATIAAMPGVIQLRGTRYRVAESGGIIAFREVVPRWKSASTFAFVRDFQHGNWMVTLLDPDGVRVAHVVAAMDAIGKVHGGDREGLTGGLPDA